jgi:hypothetical protein
VRCGPAGLVDGDVRFWGVDQALQAWNLVADEIVIVEADRVDDQHSGVGTIRST